MMMEELKSPLAEDEAFVLMGHGTEHYANSAYCQFENMSAGSGAMRIPTWEPWKDSRALTT